MQSNCPHCHSARHNLCEPGFTVKVSKATMSPEFSFDALTETTLDLIFVPVFADGELGPLSRLLDDNTGGSVAEASKRTATQGVCLPTKQLKNESLILIFEVGERKELDSMKLCQVFGTALEEAVRLGASRLIFPLVDVAPGESQPHWWQIAAATARCRLATLLCNTQSHGALKDVLVVAPEANLPQVAEGLLLDGPFCRSCPEPRLCQIRRVAS